MREAWVSQVGGDAALETEGERVVGAFLEVMQLVADTMEKVVGALHFAEGGGREKFLFGEIGHRSAARLDEGHPEQPLVIAEAAAAIFHIRFLKIHRVRELGVARTHVLAPGVEVCLLLPFRQRRWNSFWNLRKSSSSPARNRASINDVLVS